MYFIAKQKKMTLIDRLIYSFENQVYFICFITFRSTSIYFSHMSAYFLFAQ